ncbi:MAG TPA: hypothetical protein VNO30_47875 [Kofleriaceae bacterium]|nr:hypothetical protein [Kofleriaceae bacterium]
MHDRAESAQEAEPAALAVGRRAAAAAALIALAAAPSAAGAEGAGDGEEEALRPALTRHGWQLELTGYVQADSVAWSQDSVDELDPATRRPLNQERFLIRRGRVRAEARRPARGGAISGALELDGNTIDGPAARLLGAQIGYAYPARAPLVTISAGLFKTPFGAEVPASERDKPFLEPPAFARGLFPGNYDAGVMAQGRYGLARWSAALVNGAPVGDAQWRGRDPAGSYDVVLRLGAAVLGPRRLRVEAGVSAITGTGLHAGTPPTKDSFQWVDENQNGIVDGVQELQVVPGSPGTPSVTYDRDALGADLQLHWCLCRIGTGTAFAEAVLATNLDRGIRYADPIAASRDLRHLGFSIGFVQSVGPYVRAGARYDRYDVDRDAIERAGQDLVGTEQVFSTLALMAAVHWRDARLVAEYDHERNPFGRDDAGNPTTRSADRVTLRAQVGF